VTSPIGTRPSPNRSAVASTGSTAWTSPAGSRPPSSERDRSVCCSSRHSASKARVRSSSPNPEDARRAVALDVGADYAVDPIEEDAAEVVDDIVGGVDVAIEAVGNPATIQQAQSLTVPGGRTLVFGVPPEDATMEVSPFDIFTTNSNCSGRTR